MFEWVYLGVSNIYCGGWFGFMVYLLLIGVGRICGFNALG